MEPEKADQRGVRGLSIENGESAAKAADLAKEFATRFPDSTHVREAKRSGQNAGPPWVSESKAVQRNWPASVAGRRPASPEVVPPKIRLKRKMNAAAEKAMALQDKGMEVVLAEFEKGIREVMKEFPDRMEVYGAP